MRSIRRRLAVAVSVVGVVAGVAGGLATASAATPVAFSCTPSLSQVCAVVFAPVCRNGCY